MSDSPRRASTALILVTLLMVGLIGTPTALADEGVICDSDSRDASRATLTTWTLMQDLSSSALDWVQQTLNNVRDGFAWVRSYVRVLAGVARI
jgi:hypothetical protein